MVPFEHSRERSSVNLLECVEMTPNSLASGGGLGHVFIELLSCSMVLLSAGMPGLKLHIVGLQSGSVYTVCVL